MTEEQAGWLLHWPQNASAEVSSGEHPGWPTCPLLCLWPWCPKNGNSWSRIPSGQLPSGFCTAAFLFPGCHDTHKNHGFNFFFRSANTCDISPLVLRIHFIFSKFYYLFWDVKQLFLVVNLTASGVKSCLEMESASVRDYLLGSKGVNSLLVWAFEVGRCTSDLDLEVRRSFSEVPLVWGTLSAGNLYKEVGEGSFCSLLALVLLAQQSSLSQWSLPLWIPAHTENQPCGTDSWSFHSQLAIVRLLGM